MAHPSTMTAAYAKLSVPRPVFEKAKKIAERDGFRSPSEVLVHWARQKIEEDEARHRQGVVA